MRNYHNQGRLDYQTNIHHKQILKSNIKPELIEQIQISKTPSNNYKKAYKAIYMDELQKTINQHHLKKNKQILSENDEKMRYNKTINLIDTHEKNQKQTERIKLNDPYQKHLRESDYNNSQNNYNSNKNQELTRCNNYNFRDYDQQRNNRFQQHIINNYDGNYLFRHQDKYNHDKLNELKIMNKTLRQQLNDQDYQKLLKRKIKQQQDQRFKMTISKQKQLLYQKSLNQSRQKAQYRILMMKQIQQEKIAKKKKSKFLYENIARHNPITNPIQYHIDNPYILTKIQNKSQFIR